MSRSSSSDYNRQPYMRRGFYLKPENQFWLNSQDEKYKERMSKLAESFYPRTQLNLISK